MPLPSLPLASPTPSPREVAHAFHLPLAALRDAGLPSAVYYPKPLHLQPAYRAAHAAGFADDPPPPLPASEGLCARVLSLPMHPYLTEAQVARVAEALMSAF